MICIQICVAAMQILCTRICYSNDAKKWYENKNSTFDIYCNNDLVEADVDLWWYRVKKYKSQCCYKIILQDLLDGIGNIF